MGDNYKIYDLCLTLNLEITYIWKSPWSVVKALYLLTRYLTFIDVGLTVIVGILPSPSKSACFKLTGGIPWIYAAGVITGQLILSLRAWAFCGKKKHITVMLSVAWVVVSSVQFGLAGYQAFTNEFGIQSILSELNQRGCLYTAGNDRVVFANLALLLVYDAVITLFMVVPAYRSFRDSGNLSRIMYTMFMDGVAYYIYIFIVTLANMVLIPTLSPDYFTIILLLIRVIHSTLTCRVLLHAREEASKDEIVFVQTVSGI
ncbi:hypothetical protein BDQ17DRAFT_1438433 [Cyathus striatus]|nr:hypothetical protein BDQ17DRAFT_1438433 [Cyathus striatus]